MDSPIIDNLIDILNDNLPLLERLRKVEELKSNLIGELEPNENKPIGDIGWIQTYTGLKFFPLAPNINNINIEDIAYALSNICRFNGHCKPFYSVGLHSILVASIIWNKTNVNRLALWGLLHDASEAYLGDIVRPLKHLSEFAFYRKKEKMLQGLILLKYNLIDIPVSIDGTFCDWEDPQIVKDADRLALYLEIENLRNPIHPDHAYMPNNQEHLELIDKLKFTKEDKDYFLRMINMSHKQAYRSFIYDFNKYSK